MRPVVVRRWHRVLSFAAVTASFVAAVAALDVSVHRTARTAAAADRVALAAHALSERIDRQVVEIRRLRAVQFRQIHANDVRACRARHQIVLTMRGILARSVRQVETARLPGLTAAVRRTSLDNLRADLRDVARADCRRVPPLPGSG